MSSYADDIQAEAEIRAAKLVDLLRQPENDDLRALLADARDKSLDVFYREMTAGQRERWVTLVQAIDPDDELSGSVLSASINEAHLQLATTDDAGGDGGAA